MAHLVSHLNCQQLIKKHQYCVVYIFQKTQAVRHMISIQHTKTWNIIPFELVHYKNILPAAEDQKNIGALYWTGINSATKSFCNKEILCIFGILKDILSDRLIYQNYISGGLEHNLSRKFESFSGLATWLAFHPMVCWWLRVVVYYPRKSLCESDGYVGGSS